MLFLKNKCGHDVKKNICGTLISPLIEDRNHPGITSYRLRGKKGLQQCMKYIKVKFMYQVSYLKKILCHASVARLIA